MAGGKRHALGQHFLVDPTYIKKIVDSCGEISGRELWEIGIGDGALTKPLLDAQPRHLSVFELDPVLIQSAAQKWPQLQVVAGDAAQTIAARGDAPELAVGNLPYSASTAILRQFFRPNYARTALVFMFQLEVAERVLGRDKGSRGPLSLLANLLYTMDIVCQVPPGAFKPPPKVQSAVLRFDPLVNEEADSVRAVAASLFAFTARLFSGRRKTVGNNLRRMGRSRDGLAVDLLALRPENLDYSTLLYLFRRPQ